MKSVAARERTEHIVVVPRAVYLAWNVREKLRQARDAAGADPAYEANVRALEAAQPPDVPIERIFVSASSRFIPDDVMSAFASEYFGTDIGTSYVRASNNFGVELAGESTPKITDTFAIRYDGKMVLNGLDLLQHVLNGTQPVARIWEGWGKDRRQVTLPEETHRAQQMVARMHEDFRSWAKTSRAMVDRVGVGRTLIPKAIEDQYNEQFNGIVPIDHDGS